MSKYRRQVPVLPIDGSTKERILEKPDDYGDTVLEMEVMPDPVPLLLDVDPRIRIDVVVPKIKGYTAHAIGREYPWMKSRLLSLKGRNLWKL